MKLVREHIYEDSMTPFSNKEGNKSIRATYPLSKIQYEDADKSEEDEEEPLEEKFSSESDPIADMDIGGIDFNEIHKDMYIKVANKWIKILNKNLVGRTIKTKASRWGKISGVWGEYTFKVIKVLNTVHKTGFYKEIIVEDENEDRYTLGKSKVYIIK